MKKVTINNFKNERITELQESALRRLDAYVSSNNHAMQLHKKFMQQPTLQNERDYLKATEDAKYDGEHIMQMKMRELEERLYVAHMLLEENNIAVTSHEPTTSTK